MKVTIETIKHEDQRYPTLGDWQWRLARFNRDNDELTIKVSKMVNQDYEFLVMLHEFVEAYLCMRHGIPESVIDAFDKQYEASRPGGDNSEPGDDIHCPYRREHAVATEIESTAMIELGIKYDDYVKACDRMFAPDIDMSKVERYMEYVTGIHDQPLGPDNSGIEMCTCSMPGTAESNVNCVRRCPIHGGA